MDVSYFLYALLRIVKTVPYTMLIALVSAAISLVLATLVTMLRLRKIPVADQIIKVYLSFFRSTPGLIHIFLVYYGLPALLLKLGFANVNGGKMGYAVAALVLSYVAQLTEVLRPAYLSIPAGQHEAALSIGLTPLQKELRIIFPQLVPIALPAVANSFVELIKDTSILFVLGILDIMGMAKSIISNDYGAKKLEVYLAVGLVYLVIITLCGIGNLLLEERCKGTSRRESHRKEGAGR